MNNLVQSSQNNEIEIVNEDEDDDKDSSEKQQSVTESKRSQKRSPQTSSRIDQSISELEDREVYETTSSVQWEVIL